MPRLAAALTIGALVWIAILLLAAAGAAHGTASPLVLLTYEAAGLVCHQRPERSFHIAGVPLAVCARCFGLYAAAAAGALAGWATTSSGRDVSSPTARLVLGVAALPTVITVGGEWLHLIHPSSVARALAAVPLGIAAGWLIVTLLRLEGRRRSVTAHAASRG